MSPDRDYPGPASWMFDDPAEHLCQSIVDIHDHRAPDLCTLPIGHPGDCHAAVCTCDQWPMSYPCEIH